MGIDTPFTACLKSTIIILVFSHHCTVSSMLIYIFWSCKPLNKIQQENYSGCAGWRTLLLFKSYQEEIGGSMRAGHTWEAAQMGTVCLRVRRVSINQQSEEMGVRHRRHVRAFTFKKFGKIWSIKRSLRIESFSKSYLVNVAWVSRKSIIDLLMEVTRLTQYSVDPSRSKSSFGCESNQVRIHSGGGLWPHPGFL